MKDKVVLSLSSVLDIVCFNTSYLVTLYDNSFFQAQAPNTAIWKIPTLITIWGLGANNHITDQYIVSNIDIPAKI